ncbi:MAG: hypothetical protein Phyf2KO_27250 [Phycisphaerales bacterium]
MHWLAMLMACVAIPSSLVLGTMLLSIVFTAQIATSWRYLAVAGNYRAWQSLDATKRRPHWQAAFGSLAFGTAASVGAFLLWMLN